MEDFNFWVAARQRGKGLLVRIDKYLRRHSEEREVAWGDYLESLQTKSEP